MTPKQLRFIEEYLIDLNATQAAIRAGYSEKTAEVQGCRLLRNAKIACAVAEAQAKRSARVEITQDWVLRQLCENHDLARGLDQIAASTRAVELVGKHLDMFADNVRLAGKDGGPIQTEDVTLGESERAHRLAALLKRSGFSGVGQALADGEGAVAPTNGASNGSAGEQGG